MKPIGTITLNTVDEALGNRSPEGLIQHPREKVSNFAARRKTSRQNMYKAKGKGGRDVGNVTPEGLRVGKNETLKSITGRRLAARQRIARGDTGTRQ